MKLTMISSLLIANALSLFSPSLEVGHVFAFQITKTNRRIASERKHSSFFPSQLGKEALEKRGQNKATVVLQNSLNDDEYSNRWDKINTKCDSPNKEDDNKALSSSVNNRRAFLQSTGGILLATTTTMTGIPNPANAAATNAKGAAEYDMEYYLRDLLKGNKREGNLPASAPPPIPPPRTLSEPLLSLLLTDDFTTSSSSSSSSTCIPYRELLSITKKQNDASSIQESIENIRTKSKAAFASSQRVWNVEKVSDQYYFDVTSYALWKTAADTIPDYTQRDVFVRNIGRRIYKDAKSMGLITKDAVTKGSSIDGGTYGSLTGTVPAVMEVLNLFNDTQFCSSFRLGAEDKDAASSSLPPRTGYNVFDTYDDEDLMSGSSVNVLISIFNPATLGASLQITGEGSRFSPEFVGTTLAALWEEAGIYASYETYFVDPVYRPNPKDFFPDEQLLQFTLTKK